MESLKYNQDVTKDAEGNSRLNDGLGTAEPIFSDGKVPQNICINHFFQGYTDLKTGKTWMQCHYCGVVRG